MKIYDFLIENGIYPNLAGFHYLVRAVDIVQRKGKVKLIQGLYTTIAKEFDTSWNRVERAIRHILTKKIKIKDYQRIGLYKKPAVGQFIYYFASLKGVKK